MAFWDEFKEKVTETGKQAVNKTRELTEIAKIKLNIYDEEKRAASSYEKIGREYAKQFGNNSDRLLPEEFEIISDAESKIETYKERLRELKGIVVCEVCGAEMTADAKFCPKCGAAASEKKEEQSETEENAYEPKVCPKCGVALSADQEFCSECGAKIEK